MAKGKSRRQKQRKWTWQQIVFYTITLLIALSMVLSTVLWALGK